MGWDFKCYKGISMNFSETKHTHTSFSYFFDFKFSTALKTINNCFSKEKIRTIFPETLLLFLNVYEKRGPQLH